MKQGRNAISSPCLGTTNHGPFLLITELSSYSPVGTPSLILDDNGVIFLSAEQQFDFTYKVPLLKSPLEQYYLMQGGFKRTDLNDTQADSTTLGVSRFWEMSSGWQRAINLRWSLDHFTQANVTNTTMLIYPGVSVNRTRSRGGLMPTWGDSQRYSVDYSNTMWGSDINFIVMQAQDVWIRTLYDRHRFVVRGNLGWIEADNFDKVPPDLRFFAREEYSGVRT